MEFTEYENVTDAARALFGKEGARTLSEQIQSRTVVKALQSLRVAKGVSQREVAEAHGCTQSRISKIENGIDADLTLGELTAYLKATNCEVTLVISERGQSFADQVKYLSSAIQRLFDRLARPSASKNENVNGVTDFYVQSFLNVHRVLQETAKHIPAEDMDRRSYVTVTSAITEGKRDTSGKGTPRASS